MKQVTCITINTDASFCPETGASGYAFYAICDNFKIMKSGNFKVKPKDSRDAELFCLGNALHTVLRQPELPASRYIVINMDAADLISMINRPRKNIKEEWGTQIRRVYNIADKLRRACGVSKGGFQYRHVKAHVSIRDSRSWVNDWCDKEAKKWMNKEREQIRSQK